MTPTQCEIKNFWVRWYSPKDRQFESIFPWWISGYFYDDNDNAMVILVAAVKAVDENAAEEIIKSSYDEYYQDLNFSFVNEKSLEWSPFCDRFQKANWMVF